MPIDKTHMQFDESSDHTDKRTKPRDFLRPTSSQGQDASSIHSHAQDTGKGPASPQKNERAVGENGKPPLEKLQLARVSTREHPILPGGMWGGDQANRGIRAEDLARMPLSGQVKWCLRGGIAKAFGPDGDRTLVPAILHMFRHDQMDFKVRRSIAKAIGLSGCSSDFANELMRIVRDKQEYNSVRRSAAKAVGLSGCSSDFANELMRIVRDKQ